MLAEVDEHDVELTLTALARNNMSNEVIVVHAGNEAMDYLLHLGLFWAIINEPPPGNLRKTA